MVSAAALRDLVLAHPELAELADRVSEHASELSAAAGGGPKPLQDALKAAGVSKMGQRQRLAKLLLDWLPQAAALLDGDVDEASVPDSEGDNGGSGGGFWANIAGESADFTSAGLDLSRPVELNVSDYQHVAPTPRERAARARELSAAAHAMSATAGGDAGRASALEGGGKDGAPRTGTEPSSAAAEADRARSAALEQMAVYRERGGVAFGRADFAAAERWYEKMMGVSAAGDGGAAGMHAEHAAALSNLAACALAKQPADPHAAMLRLRPLLAAYPGHVKGRLRAGRACVMRGELRAAVTHYEVALAQEKPKTPAAGLQLRYTAPEQPTAERKQLMGPDGTTPLSEAAQQAAEGKAHAARLISHGERTRSLAAAGRVDEALYLARSVCRACTHSSVGQLLVLGVLEGSGRLWEAQQEAEEALETCGESDEVVGVALARVMARRGKVAEAESRLVRLAQARPGEPSRAARALKGLRAAVRSKEEGNALYRAGDVERAAAAYASGLEADGEGCLRPTLLANRAQARLQEGRVADALADCTAALALDADNVKFLLRRATCHVELRQRDEAAADYERVLRLDPSCAVAQAYVEKVEAERKSARRRGDGAGGANGGAGDGDASDDDDDEFDAYELLGLERDASAAQIKSAYRKLALKYHPDKQSDAGEAAQEEAARLFQQVNTANTLLSDTIKRRQYDAGGRIRDIMK